ncbi:hypothetical protein HWB90_gp083 [Mycobacterium phage Fowlmouth]|uniref:Uncharacterized protein n=2 Tax=Fowlmouthvirus fowlmouth TaxID=2845652 RepID=A0A7G8LPZ6_9CAUD|nr:hypothetical protein HWB90_gp083 [Mycobacterium phage Fowlmouth]AYN58056.1 hypothetical protein SEA_FOWLMOUTH_107 [Mycobacterium phage Fowlmouth]QNJ59318.1 hypothetical protein SEA_MRMIYAGI_105 [Mycobacterium phage MrMiyagi]
MSFSRKCDKCKDHFDPKDVVQLDLSTIDVRNYYTIHLCKEKCLKAFLEWQGVDR